MAIWNIGIDEKGRFDCFLEPDFETPSFVCAFLTQKKAAECEQFLKECAIAIDPEKYAAAYNAINSEECKNELEVKRNLFKNLIRDYFHSIDVERLHGKTFLNKSMKFIREREERKTFFEKIFVSPQNTDFVGSRQNYYLNSLYEVLSSVFESGIFKPRDSVNVYIAQRVLEVTGYEYPADIVVSQLREVLQDGASDDNSNDIENAISIIYKYGDKRMKNPSKNLKEGKSSNATIKEKTYIDLLKMYHDKLARSIKNFLKNSYPNIKVENVLCQSADQYVFPAMADIAATLVKKYGLKSEVAKKRSLVKGLNIKAFIEDGDIDAATLLIGRLFFDAPKKTVMNLEDLFKSVTSKNYDSVWKILTDQCIDKMHNRGIEGEQFQKIGSLIDLLDGFIDKHKPSPVVYAQYLKMKGEFAQHSGSIDLEAARSLAEKIKDSRASCRDKDEYAKLYNIEEEFWVETYAQIMFNSYDFTDADYRRILEKYESNKNLLPFYSEIKTDGDFIDKRYSFICGTLGQSLAFLDKHEESIKYLLEDYNHTNDMKYLPASFLVVEYLRKGGLENAIQWFDAQVKEVLETEKKIEPLFLDVEAGETVDNWLVLNLLRIWAYSMKIGKPVMERPFSSKWTEHDFDSYPGGLVLKWAAICNHYAKGSKETTIALLKKSIEELTKDSKFTINSLALSPMRVLNVLGAMPIEKYAETYNDLCKRCESFATYAKTNPSLDPKTECKDVWNAAMVLPFNYS